MNRRRGRVRSQIDAEARGNPGPPRRWRAAGQTAGVIYICRTIHGRERVIELAGARGLTREQGGGLRVELLGDVQQAPSDRRRRGAPRRADSWGVGALARVTMSLDRSRSAALGFRERAWRDLAAAPCVWANMIAGHRPGWAGPAPPRRRRCDSVGLTASDDESTRRRLACFPRKAGALARTRRCTPRNVSRSRPTALPRCCWSCSRAGA